MAPEPLPETDADEVSANIARTLAQLDRDRVRTRREDWETLFRQMQTLLTELATHSCVVGDLEAEMLIEKVTLSEDLEELDARLDAFAAYAVAKLEYNAALRAQREGTQQEDVPVFTAPQNSLSEVTRAQAMNGPSGSDFDVGSEEENEHAPSRRAVFRL